MDSKLPYDMIIEILSRTSLKTLDTVRCTSKEFDNLTYQSYFLHRYKKSNQTVSGFLLQSYRRHAEYDHEFAPSYESANNLDLGVLPYNSRVLAASEQGIVVFESPHPKHHRMVIYHVCKPTTKQVLALPNPKTSFLTEKVAIAVVGSKPLHYKILRLSLPKEPVLQRRDGLYSTYRCEIFDSKKWAWRLVDLVKLPYCVFPTSVSPPVTTRGSIYILLSNNDIFKFDAYSERWTTFSAPIPRDPDYPFPTRLVKYEGKLALACKPHNHGWEIWVATTDDGSFAWERRYVLKEEGYMFLEWFDDSDTSVMMDYNTEVFYKFKEEGDNMKKVVLRQRPHQMLAFRSDFEPANLSSR